MSFQPADPLAVNALQVELVEALITGVLTVTLVVKERMDG